MRRLTTMSLFGIALIGVFAAVTYGMTGPCVSIFRETTSNNSERCGFAGIACDGLKMIQWGQRACQNINECECIPDYSVPLRLEIYAVKVRNADGPCVNRVTGEKYRCEINNTSYRFSIPGGQDCSP